MSWKIVFTKMARKDAKKIKQAGLKSRVENLLSVLKENPFQNPPAYEKLLGDFNGAYSRRINIQHRLVYQLLADEKIVKVLRIWTHYE
ncbi:MAG: Txe/YoeB family addiction module toxin [Desulfurivibrionaceae bacterium]